MHARARAHTHTHTHTHIHTHTHTVRSIDVVDITTYVHATGSVGMVAPGGTAHCAVTKTMWVAIDDVTGGTATV
jgi:hypothetical protein